MMTEEEIDKGMLAADAALNLAGHQVTDPALRQLVRDNLAGKITHEEFIAQVVEQTRR